MFGYGDSGDGDDYHYLGSRAMSSNWIKANSDESGGDDDDVFSISSNESSDDQYRYFLKHSNIPI